MKTFEDLTGIAPAKTDHPGDYVCQVKKFKGKTLSSLKDYEILNYMDWLKSDTEILWSEQKEFIAHAQTYLTSLYKGKK